MACQTCICVDFQVCIYEDDEDDSQMLDEGHTHNIDLASGGTQLMQTHSSNLCTSMSVCVCLARSFDTLHNKEKRKSN